MKTNRLFDCTLEALRQRREHHQAQLDLINKATSSLESGQGLVFEAHIQTTWPDQHSIMAESRKLSEACEQARKLWADYNGNGERRYIGGIEVFARVNGLRLAIMPKDAAAIMADENGAEASADSFTLDDRVSESPNPMVFNESGTDLPSEWYTTKPTPPVPVKAVAA